jgi:hypothetical protein
MKISNRINVTIHVDFHRDTQTPQQQSKEEEEEEEEELHVIIIDLEKKKEATGLNCVA